MKQGEIWEINLSPTIGAEIKKKRPAIIVNDDSIGMLPLRIIVSGLRFVMDTLARQLAIGAVQYRDPNGLLNKFSISNFLK